MGVKIAPNVKMSSESSVAAKGYPKWPSTRFKLAVLGWVGFTLVYAMRVNLSIAIVRMVVEPPKHHHIALSLQHTKNLTSQQLLPECPADDDDPIGDRPLSREKSIQKSHLKQHNINTVGKFAWSEKDVSAIMGAFYYGYMFTQIPGGYIGTVYGGKWVYSFGLTMASLLTLITPWAAYQGPQTLWYIRFLMGFFEAVTFPSYTAMMGRWVPVFEKSVFASLAMSGGTFGNVICQIFMGYICSIDLMGGWPLGFYLIGLMGLIFVLYWNDNVSSLPQDHPTIDPLELEYIRKNTQSVAVTSDEPFPLKKVLTSVPMWAIAAAHFGNSFISYGMMTCLPQYLSNVLNFDISKNGLLSALPWVFCFIVMQLVSHFTDQLRKQRTFSTTRIRRINGIIGSCGPAIFLVLASYSGCNYVMAVFCIVVGLSLSGFLAAAYNCNHLDLSPQHAGTLFGMTNTLATTAGFLAPELASFFTSANPRSRFLWQKFFISSALIDVVAGVIYFFCASGNLQKWSEKLPSYGAKKLDVAMV